MTTEMLSTEPLLSQLAQTSLRLAELTAHLTPEQLHMPPSPDEWSATDVLAHLRACSDMWGKCIVTMLAENKPTIRAVNPRSWIKKTNYRDLEFSPSLDAFTTQRAKLLAVLKPLSAEDWLRSATLTGAGRPIERTILSFAQRLAQHERPHIKQIAGIVNSLKTAQI